MAQNSNSPNAQRFQTQEMAHIEVYGRMGNLVGKLKNVSKSGAFLEITNGDYVPNLGDVVHVTVHLQSIKRTHYLDAEVKWYKGSSIGVHFVNKDYVLDKMFLKPEQS